MQLKSSSLDGRIQHSIDDALRHVLYAISKLMEKLISIYFIEVKDKRSLQNV